MTTMEQQVESLFCMRKALAERRLIDAGIVSWEKRAIEREMLPNEREAFLAGAYHVYTAFLHMCSDMGQDVERLEFLLHMGAEFANWRADCSTKYPKLICGDSQ